MEGSRVGEIVEVGEVTTSDVAAGVISGSSLGVTFDEPPTQTTTPLDAMTTLPD